MEWLESKIWPNGRKCPDCCNPNTTESTHRTMPYYRKYRQFFSVKKGTVMERSHMSYQKWAIGTHLVAANLKGVSSMKLYRDLGMTQKSAWFMIRRLRESWKKPAGVDKMDGPAEIDEAFFGGSDKNRHAGKKDTKPKPAIARVKDRPTNKITAKPAPETTKAMLEDFGEMHVDDNAKKHTDESTSCSGLSNHESANHSVGQYAMGMAHTNGIGSFGSMMKRGYDGVLHHMTEPHLFRYVNEFAGRHNIRGMDIIDMMGMMAENMVGMRRTYKALILPGRLGGVNI